MQYLDQADTYTTNIFFDIFYSWVNEKQFPIQKFWQDKLTCCIFSCVKWEKNTQNQFSK